jgi:phosphopantothenoylcysteine decarboxylase/phosphopantothenate--cysteine ligase
VGWTEGFGADDNVATVIDREGGVVAESAGSKDEVAHAVLDAIVAQRSR